MEQLKKCKNFGEIYEVIGEKNFCSISKMMVALLLAMPIFFGVINFSMLLDIESYDAYNYNYNCMMFCNVLFAAMTLWSLLYYLGKIQVNKMTAKQVVDLIKKKEVWLLIWGGLLVWTIVPVVTSAQVFGAFTGYTFLSSGYLSHIYMWGLMGCTAMVAAGAEREDILKSFVAIADILACLMMAFEWNIPFFRGFSAATGVTVYTNRNHYGYIIAMSGAVMIGMYLKCIYEKASTKNRLFYIVSFALSMYVLMINDTLGAYLAIVLSYPVMLVLWKASGKKLGAKQFVPFAVIAVVTAMSACEMIPTTLDTTIGQSLVILWKEIFMIAEKAEGYEDAGSLRMIIWMKTVELIGLHPITGLGPDIMFDKVGNYLIDTPHNEYLECAAYLGIPGLILYLGGLFTAFACKCKKIKELSVETLVAAGAIISYLISAFVGVRKFNTVCYFFMFMGLIIGSKCLTKTERNADDDGENEEKTSEEQMIDFVDEITDK